MILKVTVKHPVKEFPDRVYIENINEGEVKQILEDYLMKEYGYEQDEIKEIVIEDYVT